MMMFLIVIFVIFIVSGLCAAQIFDFGYKKRDFGFFKAKVPNDFKVWDEDINIPHSHDFGNNGNISVFTSYRTRTTNHKVGEEWITTSAKKSTYMKLSNSARITITYIPFPTEQENIKARSAIDEYYYESSAHYNVSRFESGNISIVVKVYSSETGIYPNLSKKISDSIVLNG